MNSIALFINKILTFRNFRITDIPNKTRRELLTAFENLKRIDTVFVPELIKLAENHKGKLIIDSSDNGKYGLKHICRKMKNLKTSGYHMGFKLVLFLWQVGDYRIPIGFGLWHKKSGSVCDLALAGISRLRNEFGLKPEVVLADGEYCADKVVKRLTDYNWAFVFRWKCNRKLSNQQIKLRIPRGYGSSIGKLKNKTKVKIFRRKERYYETNRMLFEMKDVVRLYKIRWKIEETFKILKHRCLGLMGIRDGPAFVNTEGHTADEPDQKRSNDKPDDIFRFDGAGYFFFVHDHPFRSFVPSHLFIAIFKDLNHRLPLVLLQHMDFGMERFPAPVVLDHFIEYLLIDVYPLQLLNTVHERFDDDEGHPAQGLGILILVHPSVKIDLGHHIESPFFVNIDQHTGLHTIADMEGYLFKNASKSGILTGKRLQKLGKIRHEHRKKGPCYQFGHPPAASGTPFVVPNGNRSVIEGLGEANMIRKQQRPQQPVGKTMVNIFYVRVDIDNNISTGHIQRLPEVFPLSPEFFQSGQNISGFVHGHIIGSGDLARLVRRSGIDDHDLV